MNVEKITDRFSRSCRKVHMALVRGIGYQGKSQSNQLSEIYILQDFDLSLSTCDYSITMRQILKKLKIINKDSFYPCDNYSDTPFKPNVELDTQNI